MDYKLININNETIFPFVVYGNNRSSKVLEYHEKVYENFDIPMNYFNMPFPYVSHGIAIDEVFNRIRGIKPDYVLVSEIDAVILRSDAITDLYYKVKDKKTIAGGLHQSNHLFKDDGTTNRPYISPSMHLIPLYLYDKLGAPTYDHGGDCDCAEYVTKIAQEQGFCIAGIWPSEVQEKLYNLGNGLKFGYGTTYGDYYFHLMCAGRTDHEKDFVNKCQQIIS